MRTMSHLCNLRWTVARLVLPDWAGQMWATVLFSTLPGRHLCKINICMALSHV